MNFACTLGALALLSTLTQAQTVFRSQWPGRSRPPAKLATQVGGGTFSGGGADACSATVLPAGPSAVNIPFDNTVPASTSSTNPGAALCMHDGVTAIADEEWFSWTATSDGHARLDLCSGIGGLDSKVAVYADDCANLSSLDPIACKDFTGLCTQFETIVTWPIESGATYLLQIGLFPGAGGGPGDFSLEELPPLPDGQYDFGISSDALGLDSVSGEVMMLHRYDAGASATVNAVHAAFGTANGIAAPLVADGTPCTVAIYADPNDDGDPSDLVLLSSEDFAVANSGLDIVNVYALTSPQAVSGIYFVGISIALAPGVLAMPLDQSVNSLDRAYVAAQLGGTLDLANLAGASVPPAELQALPPNRFDATWLLRVDATPGGGFPSSCNGDGGDQLGCTACPCANEAPPGTIGGCLNSVASAGQLVPSGSASVSAPNPSDLRFELTGGVPDSFAVLTSGNAIAPANAANPCFGLGSGVQSTQLDGLRCAVQQTQRHGGRPVDSNGDVGVTTNGWGGASGPAVGLAAQGGFVAGQTRHYQAFYRELPGLVCSTEQNTTQAVSVTFGP